MSVLCQQAPLQVVRAFPQDDGSALVHLHNLSGGVLSGDDLYTAAELGPAARVCLTSTGATRLYRARPGRPAARQLFEISVGPGALLEYLPDPLIPYAGSRYRQETRIELADSAGLIWWDTLAPGREAGGEIFAYESLELRLEILAAGWPVAKERARIEPRRYTAAANCRLGAFRYWSTMYICRVGLDPRRWLGLEARLTGLAGELSLEGESCWAVSALVESGIAVRGLTRKGRDAAAALTAFWKVAKQDLYGREAVLPRKLY